MIRIRAVTYGIDNLLALLRCGYYGAIPAFYWSFRALGDGLGYPGIGSYSVPGSDLSIKACSIKGLLNNCS